MKYRLNMLFLLALGFGLLSCTKNDPAEKFTDYVNIFIGTGGHGHTFPGAVLPHGMVQLSPDTRLNGWDACSGYYYDDPSIIGFSHTHLSGTGIGDYGDILFMPMNGEKPLVAGSAENPDGGYRSRFSHKNETAHPGYYQVLLTDDSINVELTAGTRVGFHRYTYSSPGDAGLIIDMEPTIHGHQHPVTEIRVVNDSTIEGMKYTKGWAKNHYVYFYAVFSTSFSYRLYSGEESLNGVDHVSCNAAKAVLSFDKIGKDKKVLIKVGISSVDTEGAKKNLEAEIPHWDFDRIVRKANETWNKELSKIDVETKDTNSRTVFYTSLYHTALSPYIASDVDGRYRTMNQEIKEDSSYTNYTVFSLWDTFRALHPLYTIIEPDLNQALIRSLLRKYGELGVLPKWELASNETGTMIGYHAVSVIVDAFMKNQRNFPLEKALKACIRSSVYDTTGISPWMDRSVLNDKIMPLALKYKNEKGYVPFDKCGASVAQGLEFAYDDWLIAQMAKALGHKDVYNKYTELSRNYKNYFDPSTRLMRGKMDNGDWVTPFDPTALGHSSGYVEGNAWQWAWFVPEDVEGLIKLMGGKKQFAAHLDTLFTMSSHLSGDVASLADVTGMIGQYAHGNEPSHHIPYLYNYAGEPWKTQALTDSILTSLYFNDPNGLSGNEDCGQMSAWYVLNAMGFYSFCPGRPVYAIARPLFDKVTIHLDNGNLFTIIAHNNSRQNKYIQAVTLNKRKLNIPEFTHQELMNGGVLEFTMGDKPAKNVFK
ncbi:GH92 family glycosyl hydrolase [uncultured Bacteroides sp.]|uniref:GH92 family glycosyl hydrolase n=1 Tax=uncultured Bacteroides sp. TaxID=162156 RepID=UPI002AA846FD|nr:GH92 family glycosyl hydrolase [uncultured Bacteroides sp.]